MPVLASLPPALPPSYSIHAPEDNPLFTGRQDTIAEIRNLLHQGHRVVLHGISGVGKTQLASHFAELSTPDYQHIFWITADTLNALFAGYEAVARQVLPQIDGERNQSGVVSAVLDWLNTARGWLLVLDNVEDFAALRDYLPRANAGHVLLTSLYSAFGTLAQGVEVRELSDVEGATLLLRRGKRITPDAELGEASAEDKDAALSLSRQMQGLPLALDQAGAYLDDVGMTPAQYLQLYQTRSAELLAERGDNPTGHPEPVSVTFSLAFRKLEQINPAAIELLRACAFFLFFGIPEEVFTAGAAVWEGNLGAAASDPLLWNRAIKDVRRFSLLRFDAETKTFSIHLLVMLQLREAMTAEEQYKLVYKTMLGVDAAMMAYTEVVEHDAVTEKYIYERFSAHVIYLVVLFGHYKIACIEAARVFYSIGRYFLSNAVFGFAKEMIELAVSILESGGPDNEMYLAEPKNKLAMSCYNLGLYDEAETLYNVAIAIAEKYLGKQHESVGIYRDNLAANYYNQSRYTEAAEESAKATAIIRNTLGEEHHDTAINLHNQAALQSAAGNRDIAIELEQQSIAIMTTKYGADHSYLSMPLHGLGNIYLFTGEYTKAEPLLLKSLHVLEKEYGEEAAHLVPILNSLGSLYLETGQSSEAENYLVRCIGIIFQTAGVDVTSQFRTLNNCGIALQRQNKHEEATELLEASLTIIEKKFGPEHAQTGQAYKNLAVSYAEREMFDKAEPLFRKSLAVREKEHGPVSWQVYVTLRELAFLLLNTNRPDEAQVYFKRAGAIYTQDQRNNAEGAD